jgi:hypothetical protein
LQVAAAMLKVKSRIQATTALLLLRNATFLSSCLGVVVLILQRGVRSLRQAVSDEMTIANF